MGELVVLQKEYKNKREKGEETRRQAGHQLKDLKSAQHRQILVFTSFEG